MRNIINILIALALPAIVATCKGTATTADLTFESVYEDKVATVLSTAPEGSSYKWSVNGNVADSGPSPTIFLAHFNGNLETVNFEQPISSESAIFEEAKFGDGLSGTATYTVNDNLSLEEGTIEFWITFKAPLTSELYDSAVGGDPYIFRHYNADTLESFMILVRPTENSVGFTTYDGSGNWASGAVQLVTGYTDIPLGEPTYIAVTYSKKEDRSNIYVNGFKAASNRYDFSLTPVESFRVGNPNAVVDEVRILNKYLSNEEIREDYVRGKAFSQNDYYLTHPFVEGDKLNLSVSIGDVTLSRSLRVIPPKVILSSPDGYVIPNSSSISVNFTTQTDSTCRFGEKPAPFSELPDTEPGPSILHGYVIPVGNTIDHFPIYIKCDDGERNPDDYAFFRKVRVLPAMNNRYPKISAALMGSAMIESETASLAKYDFVHVSKENVARPTMIRMVREQNPDIILLFYIIAWSNTHVYGKASWAHEDFNDILSPAWRLMNSAGEYINDLYYPDEEMYNLNPEVPFDDALVYHVERDLISRGDFDGIYYDNTDTYFWFMMNYGLGEFTQYPDFDLDGKDDDLNDPDEFDAAEEIWTTGLDRIMKTSRLNMGDEILIVGNNATALPENYNGKMWENHFSSDRFDAFFDPAYSDSFFYWQDNTKAPKLNINFYIKDGYFTYQGFRYRFAASLLSGVYFNSRDALDSHSFQWYDEYWIDFATGLPTDDSSVGRGWLGELTGPASEILPGVWRRDFENGIVLLNNNAVSQAVDLGGTYRYILGAQDPAANPGGTTTAVTLASKDGRILLKPLP